MPRRIPSQYNPQQCLPHGQSNKGIHDVTATTVPDQGLMRALKSMHLNSKYSDLAIQCGQDSIPVHRCIVCTQSEFFARACDGEFMEARTREVILHDEPVLVRQMVKYLYTLDYEADINGLTEKASVSANPESQDLLLNEGTATPPTETPGKLAQTIHVSEKSENPIPALNPLSFHILMYSLADRMFIKGLEVLAQQKVEFELKQHLDAISFPRAILEIYDSTPRSNRGLRDLAVKITMDHLDTLRRGDEVAAAAFQDNLLESVPQFSYDLVVAIINKSVSIWDQNSKCGRNWTEYNDGFGW